jgi:amicyanin
MRASARQRHYALMTVTLAATEIVLAACAGSGSAQPGFVPTGSPIQAMPSMPSMAGTSAPVAPSSSAASQTAASGVTAVAIQNFAFSPATVSVKVGSTVTWTNKDGEAHNVTTSSGPLHSPTMQPGAVFSYTFTTAGTYRYLCTIHPFMTATVTVTP